MIPLPNQIAPFVNKLGKILAPWNFYLQQFTQAPPGISNIIVGPSPFTYTSKEPGFISVNGGTVSTIGLIRGLVSVDVTGTKLIPVAIEDNVKITYSVLPTVKFLANYGQNTG